MTLGPARYPHHSVDVQVLSWAVGEALLLSHVQNHREMKVQGQAASAGCCRENNSGDTSSGTSGGPQRGRTQDPLTQSKNINCIKSYKRNIIPSFSRAPGRAFLAGSNQSSLVAVKTAGQQFCTSLVGGFRFGLQWMLQPQLWSPVGFRPGCLTELFSLAIPCWFVLSRAYLSQPGGPGVPHAIGLA